MERPTSEIAWAGSRGPGGAARTELGASSAMERGMTMRRDTMMEQISQLNPCSQLHPLNGRLQPLCDYDIAPNCSHEWATQTFVGFQLHR